jgi:hypothetical protein
MPDGYFVFQFTVLSLQFPKNRGFKKKTMKKFLLLLSVLSISVSSCATIHTTQRDPLPPGQAKKVNGDQSAREYAPGQQNKNKNKNKSNNGKTTIDIG